MNYIEGALWNKWDLHVHTPESFHTNYSGSKDEQWKRFLQELESLPPEFKAVGINDYIFIDGYRRIVAERMRGRLKNLDLVLPVIELRLDKFAGTEGHFRRVNLHIIFSDEVEPETIQAQFINALSSSYVLSREARGITWSGIPTRESLTDLGQAILATTPEDRRPGAGPLELGFNNLNFRIDSVRKILSGSYFAEKYRVAVGKAEWSQMRYVGHGVAEKKDLIEGADLLFTAGASPAACELARSKLSEEGVNDLLLDCSDAHNFADSNEKDRIGHCYTWMKADTTFAGFCHALKEYEERVYLGDEPPKIGIVRAEGSRFVKSIEIRKEDGAQCTEKWFDCKLPINPDLVVIVGRKGSGKSALTDTIGLLSHARCEKEFSFLREERFRHPQDNKARSFRGTLEFFAGETSTALLDSHVDTTSPQRVNYIPQSFFENLCVEIARGDDIAFQKELEEVVFSRLSASERLGKRTLQDVINYRTEQVDAAIAILREDLTALNSEVAALERLLKPEYREETTKALKLRKQELADHDAAKPEEVAQPTRHESEEETADQRALREAKERLLAVARDKGRAEATDAEAVKGIAAADRLLAAITNLEERINRAESNLADDLGALGLSWSDLVNVTIDRTSVEKCRRELVSVREKVRTAIDPDDPESLNQRIVSLEQEIKDTTDKLGEPERKYQEYQAATESWQKRREEILGSEEDTGSIKALEAALANLDQIPTQLAEKRKARLEVSCAIDERLQELVGHYRDLYEPVQQFVNQHETVRERLGLTFTVAIREKGFEDHFLRMINRNVKGTFSGSEGPAYLKEIVEETDFNSKDSVLEFLAKIERCLERERGEVSGAAYQVEAQLRKNVTPEELYRYVFGLEYLEPYYALALGDKQLTSLSPGERGALLLIFYLLVDDSKVPVILDQPDENLDNETVYELLVPCIRAAKKTRQVVVVTHNPNIAVVCDAEQVIHVALDKDDSWCVTYTGGAIENPIINRRLLDVLEGTRPAFDNREGKYFD
jgi:ABC-type lipoprotein export system ATPase subunit